MIELHGMDGLEFWVRKEAVEGFESATGGATVFVLAEALSPVNVTESPAELKAALSPLEFIEVDGVHLRSALVQAVTSDRYCPGESVVLGESSEMRVVMEPAELVALLEAT